MNGLAAPISTAVLLAFVASYVDTVGFIALFSLFTAHVTGNFVVIGASLLEQGRGLTAKVFALPVFIAAVAVAHLVNRLLGKRPRTAALVLLSAQAALLVGFMIVGLWAAPILSPDAPAVMVAGLTGVFAMGLQNALQRLPLFAGLPATTVMTGNVTQATLDVMTLLVGPGVGQLEARRRLSQTWPSILAFALGAAVATLGFGGLGFWSLLAPVLLLLLIIGLVSEPAP